MFADRKDAGVRLAKKLQGYKGKKAVVLGIPRGGVVVAYEVAKALKLPLDIIVVRKVGHPSSPEFAICALDESGTMMCDEIAESMDKQWLSRALRREQDEAERRAHVYRAGRKSLDLKGKTAIIVDDGIATGLTMRVAIANAHRADASRIVVAAPVISSDAEQDFREDADEIISLESLDSLIPAVGAHYVRFTQTEDEEVIRLLR